MRNTFAFQVQLEVSFLVHVFQDNLEKHSTTPSKSVLFHQVDVP